LCVPPTIDCFLKQTTANADQVDELEERIRSLSLSEALASPLDDHDNEEKARREALRKRVPVLSRDIDTSLITLAIHRRLTGIITELTPLSEKNGLVKFLKNADYANTLNGLVQNLAYAITDYQVCGAKTIT
jgi:hypothetical protein